MPRRAALLIASGKVVHFTPCLAKSFRGFTRRRGVGITPKKLYVFSGGSNSSF